MVVVRCLRWYLGNQVDEMLLFVLATRDLASGVKDDEVARAKAQCELIS